MNVLFIDRDGTLIEEPDDFQVDALEKVRLVPGVIPALLELLSAGYSLVMVSNQDGLGTEAFPEPDFHRCHAHMLAMFESQGVAFTDIFICPHTTDDRCGCRKPRTGLLTAFLAGNDLDLERSAVIGDRRSDLELAERIGVRGLLINSGDDSHTWPEVVDLLCRGDRSAAVNRNTNETSIDVAVNLDAAGGSAVATGIGFFDHMLEQVARHGSFGLSVTCRGDLQVDEHHTVEDVALCLGSAIRKALGNKAGINRYGFLLPMDESEAKASLDLSGRPACEFQASFPRGSVGGLSTEMVEHFFRTLSESLGAAVHISVTGRNTHHMVEACFKALGRCLRQAVARDGFDLPTTKGVLA